MSVANFGLDREILYSWLLRSIRTLNDLCRHMSLRRMKGHEGCKLVGKVWELT